MLSMTSSRFAETMALSADGAWTKSVPCLEADRCLRESWKWVPMPTRMPDLVPSCMFTLSYRSASCLSTRKEGPV